MAFCLEKRIDMKIAVDKDNIENLLSTDPKALSKKRVRWWIYKEFDGKCGYCGDKLDFGERSFHIDHLVPKSNGGGNNITNLVASCSRCNLSKRNRTLEEYREWIVITGCKEIERIITKMERYSSFFDDRNFEVMRFLGFAERVMRSSLPSFAIERKE